MFLTRHLGGTSLVSATTTRCSRHLSLPSLGVAIYLKSSNYHQEKIFRNQDTSADCVHCYFSSFIVFKLSSWIAQKNIYMYVNVHKYICTLFQNLSVSLCVLFFSSGLRCQFSMLRFILASPLLHLKLIILTVRVLVVTTQTLSCVRLFTTLWAVARQAPLSVRLSRQVYWSEVPFPPPGDLPDLGIKPTFLTSPALAGGFFITSAT